MIKRKTTIISLSIILVVFLMMGIFLLTNKQKKGYLPNKLYIGSINISGLEKKEALNIVYKQCTKIEAEGINLNYQEREITIPSIASSFDADLAYTLFYCDKEAINKSLDNYQNLNPLSALWKNVLQRKATIIKPIFFVDETRITEFIHNSLADIEKDPQDAAFIFSEKDIQIKNEEIGQVINWDKTLTEINNRLAYFSQATVNIETKEVQPKIYASDLLGLENQAESLSNRELTLNYQNQKWLVEQSDIASWLDIKKNKNNINLEFSQKRIANYLEKELSPKINLDPKNHRFEIKNGKINNWQPGQNGQILKIEESAKQIITDYYTNQKNNSLLIVESIAPSEADTLNIKDIIGTGHSNFAGSPSNRRHNIAVGVESLHGLLIKANEEFSLIKALGNIDAAAGYLPELVIKGDKTIPEYGGGLCQVATTLFRGAIASGLPITARQNHSYRVSYYEPAGTDAAVYDPWPDVKFINDTGNDILIQAKIEKDDVYLDFWGIDDGRIIEIGEPVIYDITAPPPKKIIETENLKPGEQKCTERAHNGAKAYFDYTVIYPTLDETTGENIKAYRRFNSSYVPWQEVCLVGKEKTEEPKSETEDQTNSNNQASSTNITNE